MLFIFLIGSFPTLLILSLIDFPEFLSITSDNHILVSNNSFSNTNVNSSTLPRGDLDFWLLKVNNENGSVLWEEYFGGNAFDLLVAAYETPDSGYILAQKDSRELKN